MWTAVELSPPVITSLSICSRFGANLLTPDSKAAKRPDHIEGKQHGQMTLLKVALRNLKYSLIRTGLDAVSLSGAPAMPPSAAGRGAIFTLHHVRPDAGDAFAPNAVLSITPEFLEEAIGTALRCGLTPVPLGHLPTLLADPGETRRFVAFTLDDGYRDNARFAAPVFRKHDVPYTIFVTSGFVERSSTIWWETAESLVRTAGEFQFDFGKGPEKVAAGTPAEKTALFEKLRGFVATANEDEAVARLDAAAMEYGIEADRIVRDLVMDAAELRALAADPLAEFGAHTLTHVNLRRVDEHRLDQEIGGSAEALVRYVGRRPSTFSYPYGSATAVSRREIRAVADHGFEVAVTTKPGVLGQKSLTSAMALPRISLNGYYQKSRHVRALISGIPFKLLK